MRIQDMKNDFEIYKQFLMFFFFGGGRGSCQARLLDFLANYLVSHNFIIYMLPLRYVTYTKCYLDEMLSRRNVTSTITKCYQYEILPI